MDPRCKMEYFIRNGWSCGGETANAYIPLEENLITTRVKPAIQRIWKEYNVDEAPTISNFPSPTSPTTAQPSTACKGNSSTKSKINNDYIAKMFFGSDHQPNDQLEKDELREYETEAIEPTTCEPTAIYDYWAGRCNRWPKLSVMAKDSLAIPATSAASERAFSAGKDVFGSARMSLNPETVEALVCLRSWYRAGIIEDIAFKETIQEFVQ